MSLLVGAVEMSLQLQWRLLRKAHVGHRRDTTVPARGRGLPRPCLRHHRCARSLEPMRRSQAGAGRRGGDVPSALAGTSEPPDPPIDSGGGMACMPRPSDLYQTRTVVDAIVEAYDAEDRSARPWLFKNTYGNLKGSS